MSSFPSIKTAVPCYAVSPDVEVAVNPGTRIDADCHGIAFADFAL